MAVIDNIDSNYVYIDKCFNSKEDALQFMGSKLNEEGFVKDSYLGAVFAREEVYPTGLQCSKYGVALPHTDAVHVNKSILSIARLKEEVEFGDMGNPEETVKVKVIIMMALKDSGSQLDALSKVMEVLQDEEKLEMLGMALSREEIKEVFN